MSKWKPRWLKMLPCLLAPLAAVVVAVPRVDATDAWHDGSHPVFRHIEVPSDIQPTAMLQDRDGLIWIASQNGLASWDGYRFRSYIANPDIPGS